MLLDDRGTAVRMIDVLGAGRTGREGQGPMRLRVLGPLEAERDGLPVVLGGPKQRAVLALLIHRVGRRVSIEELMLGVYGDEPAAGARRTVQTYVSNLRQLLGEVIRGTGDGYVLDVGTGSIDAGQFEAAYRAAVQELEHEPERASARLREALALWRGHPYVDVECHGALDAEVARLGELRLLALERRIECDLALGRHRELVGELESLTVEEPLRESLRAHQVVALYRCGRQSDALGVVARTRRELDEELGIDPSPQLQLLERRVLVQDPTLELEPATRVEQRAVLVAELDAEGWTAGRRADALQRRDRSLASVVDQGHATVLGLRGTAVFVAFADVTIAVRTAVSLAGLGPEPMLRIALDHGDVEVRDTTITGPPVNRAARIVALGHPGQILLSPDAHRTLSAGGAPGWAATALGRHAVAGIDEPLALYQLHGDGLVTHFPPLHTGRIPPPVPRDTSGSVLGYELRARVASDDDSVLYRAYQASVGREVVVRALRRELAADPAFIRRFEAEGQRIARLAHPQILPLLDYWRDPDGAYLVHPAIEGRSLRLSASTDRMAVPDAVATVERIGAALAHACAHGVVHGRLHPENVLLDAAGNLYVLDLGLAQMCEGLVAPSASAYAAPETLGGGPLTAAADVYSLAVLAFELFEGRCPPADDRLPLPDTALGAVLARATSPDPAHRQADVGVLVAEIRAAATGASSAHRALTEVRNPYRGLEPFLEADAEDFRGRESLVAEMVDVLDRQRLLTVVGPSGIGKSSVVRAGLVPALRGGAIDGSDRWLVADLVPGAQPFEALAAALRRVAVGTVDGVAHEIVASEEGLTRCVDRVLPTGSELLLVVDQFEELFTQTTDEGCRRRFLATLAAAATDGSSRVRIVVTLRADFFDRPLHHPAFAELMRRGVTVVRAPRRDELARAIREPAERVGVTVEDALVERMTADADDEPGGLPLLQHVLAEQFEGRRSDVLTLEAYDASGGLRGAVGRRAEELYLSLTAERREVVREVFLQLVTVDDEVEDTRRRVRLTELSRLEVSRSGVALVVELFGSHRLLTFDRDPATRGPTVEVAHESLLTEWERLGRWIDDVRDDLLTRRRLATATTEWEAAGRDPGFLLGPGRLEAAERWWRSSELSLTEAEEDYLAAGRQAVDRDARRARRRRRLTVGALTTALVATLAFSAVAATQRGVAEEQIQLTLARQLAADALLAIEADPERAILLALEAVGAHRDVAGRPVPEATSALQTAVHASRVTSRLPGGVAAVAFSPDGDWLVTDVPEPGVLRVVDARSGAETALVSTRGTIGSVAFSPDARVLAVSYLDTGGEPAVETFDVGTWAERATYDGPPGAYLETRFTDDGGRYLVAVGRDGEAIAWEVESGQVTAILTAVLGSDAVHGSSLVAFTRGGEEVDLVDVSSGETVETLPTPGMAGEGVAVDGEGSRVAVNSFSGRSVEVWDRRTGGRLAALSNPSPTAVGWAPDGRVVHASNDGSIRLVAVDGEGDDLVLRGHDDGVTGLAFSADGRELASTSYAGETRTWDVTAGGSRDLATVDVPEGFVWHNLPSPDDAELWMSVNLPSGEQRIEVADPVTGRRTVAVEGLWSHPHQSAVFAEAAGGVAALNAGLQGHVYDLPSGRPRLALQPCQLPKALSDDGDLVIVDGRLLCTDVVGPAALVAPADASLSSAVVDGRTGEVIVDLGERPINWAALGPSRTPSARYAAVSIDWRSVEVHDVEERRPVGTLELGDDLSTTIWFSPDGRHLTVGTQSGRVTVLDVTRFGSDAALEDAVAWRFQEPGGSVVTHARVDHGLLATASMAGRVRVYDLDQRDLLADLQVEALNPISVSFSRDGASLRYEDGRTVRRLFLDPERSIALARSLLTRSLTPEECAQYRVGPPTCEAEVVAQRPR